MGLFKLIKDEDINQKTYNSDKIKHVKVYESENYRLRIFNYNSGYNQVDIQRNENSKLEYSASLYLREDHYNFTVTGIEIQTLSYGSLGIKDIQKVINGYNIAIESAIELKEILKANGLLKV